MTRPRGRAGMSLVELLIALVLFGIVGGAVMGVIVRQQRVSQRASTVVDTRDQSRIALATLAAELKALSSVGGDIAPGFSGTGLTIRTLVGTSVICRINAARTMITIPPDREVQPVTVSATPNETVTLTSFVNPSAPLAVNDTVWALDPNAPAADPWIHRGIVMPAANPVSGAQHCPSGLPGNYMTAANAALPGLTSFQVSLDGPLPAGVTVGSPVRFTRTVRYSVQQDPTTSEWYLMYQTCTGGPCTTAQPLAGPFRPVTADVNTTGFLFRYYDETGAVTNVAQNIARIDVLVRTVSREQVSAGGSSRQSFIQSDSLQIALRNRR
ncbi:MAG TPA: type II secretion system protein [Gemmatimonadaceae bacterium]|nr:type II secretion system protein [Gemmatimonadaceae bacterium]